MDRTRLSHEQMDEYLLVAGEPQMETLGFRGSKRAITRSVLSRLFRVTGPKILIHAFRERCAHDCSSSEMNKEYTRRCS